MRSPLGLSRLSRHLVFDLGLILSRLDDHLRNRRPSKVGIFPFCQGLGKAAYVSAGALDLSGCRHRCADGRNGDQPDFLASLLTFPPALLSDGGISGNRQIAVPVGVMLSKALDISVCHLHLQDGRDEGKITPPDLQDTATSSVATTCDSRRSESLLI